MLVDIAFVNSKIEGLLPRMNIHWDVERVTVGEQESANPFPVIQ